MDASDRELERTKETIKKEQRDIERLKRELDAKERSTRYARNAFEKAEAEEKKVEAELKALTERHTQNQQKLEQMAEDLRKALELQKRKG